MLLSLLVMVLVAEVVLHAVGYPRTKTGHQRFFVEYDADRGWRNVPGASGDFTTDEYQVHLEYNSRGIRGPELAYEKPAGTFRVVLLGDSFLEGYSVLREDRVAEVLERLLAEADPSRRYEVIALGTAGYSTDQELLWLESEGLRYQPDVVVALFYMNDVWFNGRARYWRGEKPLFVLQEDGSLELTNVPVPPPGDGKGAKGAKSEKPKRSRGRSGRVWQWLRANSKLYAAASLALEQSPGLRNAATSLGLISPRKREKPRGEDGGEPTVRQELSVFASDESEPTREAWRITAALLDAMDDKARAAGARFIAFHIPFKGAVYEEDWRSVLADLQLGDAQMDRDRVAQRFDAICTERRLDCIEPTQHYREAARSGADRGVRLYYVQDNHWNAHGHALAAELLAREVAPGARASTADPGA
jgi:lysophospholipase L1-like esterase